MMVQLISPQKYCRNMYNLKCDSIVVVINNAQMALESSTTHRAELLLHVNADRLISHVLSHSTFSQDKNNSVD